MDARSTVAGITYGLTNRYVDMHGTTALNTGADLLAMTSVVQFAPGTWTIQFYWGDNGSCATSGWPVANSLVVTLGDAPSQTLVGGPATQDLTLQTLTFTNSVTGRLVFAASGNTLSDSGPLPGAVSVAFPILPGVPEPASALLLLPGLAAVAWCFRRRD